MCEKNSLKKTILVYKTFSNKQWFSYYCDLYMFDLEESQKGFFHFLGFLGQMGTIIGNALYFWNYFYNLVIPTQKALTVAY